MNLSVHTRRNKRGMHFSFNKTYCWRTSRVPRHADRVRGILLFLKLISRIKYDIFIVTI